MTVLFNIFKRQTLTDYFRGLHKNMNCAFSLMVSSVSVVIGFYLLKRRIQELVQNPRWRASSKMYILFVKRFGYLFCFTGENAFKHFLFINTVLQSSGSFYFSET